MILILGAGKRDKLEFWNEEEREDDVVTIDINPDLEPDIVMDLNALTSGEFPENHFDKIYARQILEHLGRQGDWRFFFYQWNMFWKWLKPDGEFYGEVPDYRTIWAWGDPGHTRIFNTGTLVFLDQNEYERQVGVTPMTDYRNVYHGNFKVIEHGFANSNYSFRLRAIK